MVVLMVTNLHVTGCAAPPYGSNFTDFSGVEFAKDSQQYDVAYVPTSMIIVNSMLEMGSVGPDDYLIDLGSGDGRIVITAAKMYGARGFGVDLNPKLVELSKKYAAAEGVENQIDFFVQDLFKTDIRNADVITMYLLPEVNLNLRPKLLRELKPGVRVVSHEFHMGDWRPEKIEVIEDHERDERCLYLWIIPAKVSGEWKWQFPILGEVQNFLLEIEQYFQNIDGVAMNQDMEWSIFNASLHGDQITFSLISEADKCIVRHDYQGSVKGDIIDGTVMLSGAIDEELLKWKAIRVTQ